MVLETLRRLAEDWRQRGSYRHPYLSPGDIVPTTVAGGEWSVSYPASCRLVYHVAYLPGQTDEDGWGTVVQQEISEWVTRAAAADPWLAANPPAITWAPEVPPAEVAIDEPVVQIALAAGAAVGRPSRVAGLDSWFDGATFTRGGTPSIAFGPGDITRAHTMDEYVTVDNLVAGAQALALAALRFCGEAP